MQTKPILKVDAKHSVTGHHFKIAIDKILKNDIKHVIVIKLNYYVCDSIAMKHL